MIPRGTSRSGSVASSAASGTPSMARKNQMANGSAAHTPSQPFGSHAEAPAAAVSTGRSTRLAGSKRPTAATAKTIRPTRATTVMAAMIVRASPAPDRWMAMKIR